MGVDPDLAETDQAYAYAGDDPVNASDPSGRMGTSNTVYDLGYQYWQEIDEAYIPFFNTSWRVAENWFGDHDAKPKANQLGNGAAAYHNWHLVIPGIPLRVVDWMVGWPYQFGDDYFYEIKSGYQSLSASSRQQIKTDAWLVSQGGYAEWDFYPNYENTNYQTTPLVQSILSNNINIVIHKDTTPPPETMGLVLGTSTCRTQTELS